MSDNLFQDETPFGFQVSEFWVFPATYPIRPRPDNISDTCMRIRLPHYLILLSLTALAACDQNLETGYAPKRLNATTAERRAFYAPQFSPEAHPSKDSGGAPDMFGHH